MAKPKNHPNKNTGKHSETKPDKNIIKRRCDNFIKPSQKVIAAIVAILLLALNFVFKHPDPHYAVWLSCLIAELVLIELFLYFFMAVKQRNIVCALLSVFSLSLFFLAIFLPGSLIPDLKKPVFNESTEEMIFSLGEGGISVGYSKNTLINSKIPFKFSGYEPVKMYVDNDILYADVNIYSGSGFHPIEIKHNKLFNKPNNWDFNSNDKALEVVDENKTPIYQFFYKTPSHIVMNGVFPIPNGIILANEKGAILNPPILPATFKLKRIFKYPAWRYPGEYES